MVLYILVMDKENKKLSQEEVWDGIAKFWKEHRIKPVSEVVDFLKNKQGKVLDLGCGGGRNFIKQSSIEIYGVDFSQKMLDYAKKHAEKEKINVELVKSSANNLPFKDNFFDSAIFIAVLHCIEKKEQRKKAIEELFRVLKPNSEALIRVWNKDQKRFKNKDKEAFISWKTEEGKVIRYYYLYEKEELKNLLESSGFKIVKVIDEIKPQGVYSKRNIVFIVKKPISA